MGDYKQFKSKTKEIADQFLNLDRNTHVRIISHNDSDGMCACAILTKTLADLKMKYSISIVQHLDKEFFNEISGENYSTYIFADLGSGNISRINKYLKEKKVFILDHHTIEECKEEKNIFHLNPYQFGINASKEIAGAGMAFLFSCAIDKNNESMAHLAVIGALGDIQEEDGFMKLNNDILEKAVAQKTIKVKRELNVFGRETKPLYKILEHLTNPFVPNVSGNENGAKKFLNELGISYKRGKENKVFSELTKTEEDKINKAIFQRRLENNLVGDIFGNSYILLKEKKKTPLRDAREFSTLLNACGRMNKTSIGLGSCLGSKKCKEEAIKQLKKYKKEITNIVNWYKEAEKQDVIRKKGYVIINGEDNIPHQIIGTLGSIISRTNEYEDGTYILALARIIGTKTTKVSMRVCGGKRQNINDILSRITDAVGGESGGHLEAAGALIPTIKESKFIEIAQKILDKEILEEKIN